MVNHNQILSQDFVSFLSPFFLHLSPQQPLYHCQDGLSSPSLTSNGEEEEEKKKEREVLGLTKSNNGHCVGILALCVHSPGLHNNLSEVKGGRAEKER